MCGAVRYELSKIPEVALWCHCTRCQRRSGGPASVQARIVPGSMRIVQGEDLLDAWKPPDGAAKVFCSRCGSQLWSQSPDDPGVRSVRLGTFDADPGVRPSFRQFVAYAAAWDTIPEDGLPRFPERRPT
jgi:hypothetical protein